MVGVTGIEPAMSFRSPVPKTGAIPLGDTPIKTIQFSVNKIKLMIWSCAVESNHLDISRLFYRQEILQGIESHRVTDKNSIDVLLFYVNVIHTSIQFGTLNFRLKEPW